MFDINADTYAKNFVHTIKVIQKGNKSVYGWKCIMYLDNLGVRNMHDLTIKTIKGIYKTKTPIKE